MNGMSSYRDDTLRLTYSIPSNYVDAMALVGPAFQASIGQNASLGASAKCITLPLSRMASEKGQIAIVLLVRADAGCLKRKFTAASVTELTKGEAQGISASGAKSQFGDPLNFEIAKRPASLVQGNFTLPTGQVMQSLVVCVLDQPDVACWQYLANNTEALATMSSFPVAFDGSPATPLAPVKDSPGH